MDRIATSLVVLSVLVACGGDDSPFASSSERDGSIVMASDASDVGDPQSRTSDMSAATGANGAEADAAALKDPERRHARPMFVYVGGWDWSSGMTYPFRSFALIGDGFVLAERGTSDALGFNPAFIAASHDGALLYVANEFPGERAGITVARRDPQTGTPSVVDRVSYADGAFVYAAVHPSSRYLFAVDFYGGGLVVYRIEHDGKLGPIAARETFPRKSEADSAQSHSVGIHADGRFVYVPNKKLDAIAMLIFDVTSGRLSREADIPSTGGPRHIALHGNIAYVMHENASQLASFRVEQDGALTPLVRRSTLPSDYSGDNTGAHVLVHPSGRFVYASNRGHDSIAVFSTDDTGDLTLIAHTKTGGKTPRHFDIDPRGELLVVANQGSESVDDGSLVSFAVEPNGALTPRGSSITRLRSPTAVRLVAGASKDDERARHESWQRKVLHQ